MTNRRLKKSVIPIVYALIAILFVGSIFLIERAISNSIFEENKNYNYVDKTIIEEEIPVVNTEITIMRPFTDKSIKILKNYYDYKGDKKTQQESILYYESTYLQNTGIAYGGLDNSFDVVAILDGTVVDVKEDKTLGKIIEIRHDNDLISVYQSLSDIAVKKDEVIKQGQIIAKSGESNIGKDLKSHLHFELIFKGLNVNPEDYYDKLVSDL